MKIDMWLFNRICEITNQEYEFGKSDDEETAILFKNVDNMLYDLVEEYGVLEEKYEDLKKDMKENYKYVGNENDYSDYIYDKMRGN